MLEVGAGRVGLDPRTSGVGLTNAQHSKLRAHLSIEAALLGPLQLLFVCVANGLKMSVSARNR